MRSSKRRFAVIGLVVLVASSCSSSKEGNPGATPQPVTTASTVPEKPQVLPLPLPIPGGTQIPGGPFIHVFAPGPEGAKLPISGFPFSGLEVDRSTLTNFQGFSATAYVAGEATGSDGKRYQLETDMRVFKGSYRAADGIERTGVFGFI